MDRGSRCGGCHQEEKFYYPGSSITHDLMCLCTPGKAAEPFYGYYWWLFGYKANGFKLCGKLKEDMGVNLNHGWYSEGRKKEANGLEKSWKAVIMGCFNGWKNRNITGSQDLTEKLQKLTEAMTNFTKILKQVNGMHKLGWTKEHTPSDGTDEKRIHVHYNTCNGKRKPWWKRLNETLTSKTPEQLLVPRKTQSPSSEPSEELNDGPEEELLEGFAGVEGSEPESFTADGGSASQVDTENATQMQGPTNSTESTVIPLNATASGNSSHPRLEYLRSGSHINQPLLFLGAIFLI
ncbi:unnamed protein product [Trypanosoma congolense IL3000]|uniref:WGS project CAEQ00000000 data, annotated contig 230 n=1 Tax=Trypanosoma congolense (strain IL3000) TaxID=1068625 RepID=F9WD06_TRYCI|nr:unnamed protein product [Trypanosoma congolense IL3000]